MGGLKIVAASALFAFGVSLLGIGCSGECPPGYEKSGGFCRAGGKNAGAGTNGSSTNPATEAGAGSAAGSGPGASPVVVAAAGSGGAAASGGPSKPVVGGTSALCQGHANQAVCDGAVLYHCGADGSSGSPTACMSAALCQAGLASGACAVCTPGTFHCQGAELDVCTDAGQYMKKTDCATAMLCKEAAGQCTDMMCMPNGVSCSSDGTTLNTCNADGSAFADQKSCENKGCNQAMKSCNKCMPGEKTCNGSSLVTCAADGQSMSMMACMASGECAVATCENSACADDKKPMGTPCSIGKCDASGKCVACLSASDCPATDCAAATCNGGVCGTKNQVQGAPCGADKQCDGSGRCVDKDPCGDGKFDPAKEACDPTSPEWINGDGACSSSCKLTVAAYHVCAAGGGSCWQGAPTGYFCSVVGACTRVCNGPQDCPPGGSCVTDAGRTSQKICVTTSCQEGESPQWYGRQGCLNGPATIDPSTNMPYAQCVGSFVPQQMCGWVSADPTTQKLWCPAEHSGSSCCPPGGGQCVSK